MIAPWSGFSDIRRGLRRILQGPPESLLAQKIRRAGGRPQVYRDLLALNPVEGMATLRRVTRGEEPSLAFLSPARSRTAALAQHITGGVLRSEQEAQRLYSVQLVQLLLVRWFDRLSRKELESRVQLDTLDTLREIQAKGRSAVLLGSHIGPARLVPYLLARFGLDLAAIMPRDFYGMVEVPLPQSLEIIRLDGEFGLRALASARQLLSAGKILHSTGDGLRMAARERYRFLGKERGFPISQQLLAVQQQCDCLPIFIRAEADGRLHLELGEPLQNGPADQPPMAQAEHMLRGYVAQLEERWICDFGNVPAHALQLYDVGWDKNSARALREAGES